MTTKSKKKKMQMHIVPETSVLSYTGLKFICIVRSGREPVGNFLASMTRVISSYGVFRFRMPGG